MRKYFLLACCFIAFSLSVSAQIATKNCFWLQSDYLNDLRYNKEMLNNKKFFKPIELFLYRDNKLYFTTLNGRLAEARYDKIAKNTYELKNVHSNINRMYASFDKYKDYKFTLVNRTDTLLLIKTAPSNKPDTMKYTLIKEMGNISPYHVIEGYLLLEGSFKLTDNRLKNNGDKISFDLHGKVNAPNCTEYRVLHSSLSLEEPFRGHISFLLEFKDREGKVNEKIMLYKKKKNLELYDFTRNSMFNYELKEDSKICLMAE